jgi:23S rRNA pseudouridine1911/1915/1917 synthase
MAREGHHNNSLIPRYRVREPGSLLMVILEMYKGMSRQKAKQLLGYSTFLCNGKELDNHPGKELKTGDLIEIIPTEKRSRDAKNPDKRKPVAIFYEDDYLVAAIKPAGILTNSEPGTKTGKTYHKILESFISNRDGRATRLWVIHRLDIEVEGLILFAKSQKIMEQVKSSWSEVVKKYLALTAQKPDPPDGMVESWLLDTPSHKVISYDREVEGSRFARTSYHFIEQRKGYSLLEVTLHTGRKNQIRVHLSEMGCPIVGDRKYGADDSVSRQIRLAAWKLELPHPVTGRWIALRYDPPNRFYRPSEKEDEQYRIL